jgi:hypothetical protein
MEGQIVDVEYEDQQVDMCKIISQHTDHYTVKPLVYDPDKYLYKFSHYTFQVPIESVSGFYDTTDIEDTGQYIKIDGVHYRSVNDSDPEYEMDSDDSDTESDISLYDENDYEYE